MVLIFAGHSDGKIVPGVIAQPDQMAAEKPDTVKIDKWDSTALKNALDDAVKSIMLEELRYVERFTLVDIRLALSTLAVGLALFAIAWDYLYPFPLSRYVLLVCACLYFLVSGVLTLYSMLVERCIFFVAVQRDQARIEHDRVCEVSSKLKRFDDKYNLEMCYKEGGRVPKRSASVQRCVAEFVDTNGVVVKSQLKPVVLQLHSRVARAASKKE